MNRKKEKEVINMKRITAIILSLLLLAGVAAVCPFIAVADTSGNFKYSVLNDNTAVITGYTGKEEKITIPETIGGHTVTEIGKKAFQGYGYYGDFLLKSVTFNKSLKKIGERAFEETALEKVTFNEGLEEIGKKAFYITFMESIKLPSTLKYLRAGCFKNSGLTSVDVPKSVKVLEKACFSGCELEKVTLHKGLKEIGFEAFACSNEISSIKIPSTVKKIGGGAFAFNPIEAIKLPKSLKTIEEYNDYIPTFGEDLKKISLAKGNKHFRVKSNVLYNRKMTQIYVYPSKCKRTNYKTPKTVKTIRKCAFYQAKFKKLTVTKNVKSIRDYAFFEADVKKFKLETGSKLKTIGKLAFYHVKVDSYPWKLTLPNGIKKISESAFEDSDLSYVKLPSKLKSIEKQAFFGTYLESITIPKSVKKIGYAAFGYNSGECGSVQEVNKSFVVKGKKNSYAYKYAKKKGFKFVAI